MRRQSQDHRAVGNEGPALRRLDCAVESAAQIQSQDRAYQESLTENPGAISLDTVRNNQHGERPVQTKSISVGEEYAKSRRRYGEPEQMLRFRVAAIVTRKERGQSYSKIEG